MEGLERGKFQGVWNIVRFNWHFYLIAGTLIIALLSMAFWLGDYANWFLAMAMLISLPLIVSLFVSYYVYDLSGLYDLKWLDAFIEENKTIVNINAGFDETSALVVDRFKPNVFKALDFYNSELHTEVSIKRARRAGLVYPNTISFQTDAVPLENESVDYALLIFSLHEIRSTKERIDFMKSLRNKVKPSGKIIVVEHLRDWPNFIAYTIGFFHFYSLSSWRNDFRESNLQLLHCAWLNPFVRIFVAE